MCFVSRFFPHPYPFLIYGVAGFLFWNVTVSGNVRTNKFTERTSRPKNPKEIRMSENPRGSVRA
jgi:hypothetical protein